MLKKQEQSIYSKKNLTEGKLSKSLNLIKLAKIAKSKKIEIIALLGKGGGGLKKIANQSIIVNSNKTGSIQETHKIIFHSICETFENI